MEDPLLKARGGCARATVGRGRSWQCKFDFEAILFERSEESARGGV
jgi:hypothetical protein